MKQTVNPQACAHKNRPVVADKGVRPARLASGTVIYALQGPVHTMPCTGWRRLNGSEARAMYVQRSPTWSAKASSSASGPKSATSASGSTVSERRLTERGARESHCPAMVCRRTELHAHQTPSVQSRHPVHQQCIRVLLVSRVGCLIFGTTIVHRTVSSCACIGMAMGFAPPEKPGLCRWLLQGGRADFGVAAVQTRPAVHVTLLPIECWSLEAAAALGRGGVGANDVQRGALGRGELESAAQAASLLRMAPLWLQCFYVFCVFL